jgi:hypothetical protein
MEMVLLPVDKLIGAVVPPDATSDPLTLMVAVGSAPDGVTWISVTLLSTSSV